MTRRTRRPALGPVAPLEDRTVPATAFALSDNALIPFDTSNPAAALPAVPITGLASGDVLAGIDVRPQNGELYGIGVNSTTAAATLYHISTRTGAATAVGAAGSIAFVGADGTTPVVLPLASTGGYGFAFDPVADRIRVTTTT